MITSLFFSIQSRYGVTDVYTAGASDSQSFPISLFPFSASFTKLAIPINFPLTSSTNGPPLKKKS